MRRRPFWEANGFSKSKVILTLGSLGKGLIYTSVESVPQWLTGKILWSDSLLILWGAHLNSLLKQGVLIVYINHGLLISIRYWGERAAYVTRSTIKPRLYNHCPTLNTFRTIESVQSCTVRRKIFAWPAGLKRSLCQILLKSHGWLVHFYKNPRF